MVGAGFVKSLGRQPLLHPCPSSSLALKSLDTPAQRPTSKILFVCPVKVSGLPGGGVVSVSGVVRVVLQACLHMLLLGLLLFSQADTDGGRRRVLCARVQVANGRPAPSAWKGRPTSPAKLRHRRPPPKCSLSPPTRCVLGAALFPLLFSLRALPIIAASLPTLRFHHPPGVAWLLLFHPLVQTFSTVAATLRTLCCPHDQVRCCRFASCSFR